MSAIKLRSLSMSDAEEAIAELWSCLETYGIPSPKLKATRTNKRITIELSGFDEPLWTTLVDTCLSNWRRSKIESTRVQPAEKAPTENDRERVRLLAMEKGATLSVPHMSEMPVGAIAEINRKAKRRYL